MSGSDRRDSYTSRRDSPAPTRDDTSDRNVPNGPRLNSTSYSRPSSSYDSRDRTSSSYSRHDARDAYASSRRDSSNYARSSRDDYYDRPSSSYEDRKHYDSRDREDRPSSRAMERNPSEGSSSREPPAVAAALPDRPTSKPLSKKALIPSIPFRKPSSVGSYTAPAPTSARPADPIPPSSRPSDPPPPPPQEPLHVPSPPKAPEPIEKLKPAFRVTYDPLLDTSPVKKSKTIIMRVGGEGLPGGPLPDPRKEASFDRSNGRKSLTHLTELEYAFDKNSVGPPPLPPASGIVVSKIHTLTPADQIHKHFAQYGRISQFDFKLDAKTGGALGLAWVKYADDTVDSSTGLNGLGTGSRKLPPRGQDGHAVACEAMKKTNGKKIGKAVAMGGKEGIVLIQLDGNGDKCKALFNAEMQRRSGARKQAAKLAEEKKSATPARLDSPEKTPAAAEDDRKPSTSKSSTSYPEERSRGRGRSRSRSRSRSKSRGRDRSRSRSRDRDYRDRDKWYDERDQSRDRDRRYEEDRPSRDSAFGRIPAWGSRSAGRDNYRRDDRDGPRQDGPSPWKRSTYDDDRRSPPAARMQSSQPQLKTHASRASTSSNKYLRDRTPVESSTSDSEDDENERARRDDLDKVFFPRTTPRAVSGGSGSHISPITRLNRSPEALAARAAADKERAERQLKMNGFPYLTINKADLAAYEKGRPTAVIEEQLKTRFSDFKPAQVLADASFWYILFREETAARRCHVVMDRTNIGNVPLSLTLHDSFEAQGGQVNRQDKPRSAEQTREQIIDEACRIIANDLKVALQKDIRSRLAPTLVQQALEKQMEERQKVVAAGGDMTMSPGLPSVSSESSLVKLEEVSVSIPESGSVPPADQPPTKRGILKLPTFARRKVPDRPKAADQDYRDSHSTRSSGSRFKQQWDNRTGSSRSPRQAFLPPRPSDGSSLRADTESVFSESVADEDAASETSSNILAARRSFSPAKQAPSSSSRMEVDSSEEEQEEELPRASARQKKRAVDYSSSEDEALNRAITEAQTLRQAEASPRKKKLDKIDYTSSEGEDEVPKSAPPLPSIDAMEIDQAPEATAHAPEQLLPPPVIRPGKPKKPVKAHKPLAVKTEQESSDPFELGLAKDEEDLYYLRMALERLQTGLPMHPPPPDNEEDADGPHQTGSARTEGYYKIAAAQKSSYLPQRNRAMVDVSNQASSISVSRNARASTRALVHGIEQQRKTAATDTDVLKFNQLRARKKQLKFARSPIHDWGLYAMEAIDPGDLIVEYVGELIRQQIADRREKNYERMGIGSSYLFRVDDDWVVDATKKGSMSRLINHSCTPNCIAKIMTIQGNKKIVIYARQTINPGDEITYDYKFASEADELKIPCLCGSSGCRKYLN